MNSLPVLIVSVVIFTIAYRFYGRYLSRKFSINSDIPTPAHTERDGVDFVPAKNWMVLFGHHFSSISGAGPIVGPVLACMYWGWGPALLWILVGSVLIGGVHDFGALALSMNNSGSSIAAVSEKLINRRVRILFSLFIWLALILVIALFAILAAKTYVSMPEVVIPSFGIIFVAPVVGYFMYNLNKNLAMVTIAGLSVVVILMVLGNIYPVKCTSHLFWMIVLFAYCFIASITPVHILLQPRDYLSAYFLFFGIIFGVVSVLITRPDFTLPFYTDPSVREAAAIWPMLFVTVACGAVSGFHSVVASGTTSKQIANQRDAVRIGYGGMLVEGLLAVLALISVGACVGGVSGISGNPIDVFSRGYGSLTSGILKQYGAIFAATMLNIFILTTLDSATRITRYISEELFGIKNRYLATLLVIGVSLTFAFSGEAERIWPIFGASNQLVAALALIIISTWVLSKGKSAWMIILPTVFMLVTTVAALVVKFIDFNRGGDYKLMTVVVILLMLSLFLVYEAVRMRFKARIVSI